MILLAVGGVAFGTHDPSIGPLQRVFAAGGPPVLGIDCGLGSTQAVPNPLTGLPEGDGNLDISCTWKGDIDNDGARDPLVSDRLTQLTPNVGGGFTAEIRATGLPAGVNGFDITLSYNTNYLDAIKIDQTGLPFGGTACPPGQTNCVLTLNSTIDRASGVVRLAQVLLGALLPAGDVTFFRVRFDVVGVGSSPLTISRDVITTPSPLAHKTQAGSLDSSAVFDPGGSLGFNVYWGFSPNPPIPGSPLTFTATASCPGCGSLTYDWDSDSDGASDATGSLATLSGPPPPIVHRVVLTVTDGPNSAVAVRRLPLRVLLNGPSTVAVGGSVSWTGSWVGGIPPYRLDYRFCPGGTSAATAVCSVPTATLTSVTEQANGQTLNYKYAGAYNVSLKVTESTVSWISAQALFSSGSSLVIVRGSPQAYTVTLTNPGKANAGDPVTITTSMAYFPGESVFYDANGNNIYDDGETVIAGPPPLAGDPSADDPRVKFRDGMVPANMAWDPGELVFYDTDNNIAFSAIDVVIAGTAPGSGTVRDDPKIRFVDSVTGGVFNYAYPSSFRSSSFEVLLDFGDSINATLAGGTTVSTSHVYTSQGPYAIKATAKEISSNALTKIQETTTSTIAINQPSAFDYSLSLNPSSATVARGADTVTTTATVAAELTSGVGEPVTVSATVAGPSTGVTATLNPNPVTPTGSSTLDVAISPTAVIGTYTITITGSPAGATADSAVFTLMVEAPAGFDFTVTVNPDSGTVTQGNTITATVSVTPAGGTPEPVSLTESGIPQDSTISFDPALGTPPFTSTITIATSPSTPTGPYTIFVTGTSLSGTIRRTTFSLTVNPSGLPLCQSGCDFTFGPTPVTAGKPVTFSATATDGTPPYSFRWTFGDNTPDQTAIAPTVDHTYTTKGSYTVSLIISDASTASSPIINHQVTVIAQQLTADFSFSPQAPATGEFITFTATAGGGTGPYSFSWDFGDSTTGTGNPVSHSYSSEGDKTITLTVTDANSQTTTATKTVTVVARPPLCSPAGSCDFTFNPASPMAGDTVTFTATVAGGTPPYTFSWDFGDLTTGAGNPVTHVYTAKGPKHVTLSIKDSSSPQSTLNVSHDLTVAPEPLLLEFGFSPEAPTAGQAVTFTAAASGGTSPYEFSWDFGDATTGTGSPIRYIYTAKGTYVVTLTVRDANAATATASRSVIVTPQDITVSFTVDDTTGNGNGQFEPSELLRFAATVTGGTTPYSYTWDFDGTTATGNPTTHSFNNRGNYEVTLTVQDSNGVSRAFSSTITLANRPPTVEFTIDKPIANPNVQVILVIIVSDPDDDLVTVTVDWKDGATEAVTGLTASHAYTATGDYAIVVTATDSQGASVTKNATIRIRDRPVVSFTATSNTFDVGEDAALTLNIIDPDGTIANVVIAWGDGTTDSFTSAISSASHKYAAEGSYTITVTATDSDGMSTTSSSILQITTAARTPPLPGNQTLVLVGLLAALTAAIGAVAYRRLSKRKSAT